MTSRSNYSGRFGLLDIVVLIAMAITATAFAAGLILNSGIDIMTGAIAAAALFMVMASSQYVISRQARSASITGRMDELEEALVVLDGDLQRIDQVEDDVARLDLLTDRVERIDQAISEYTGEPGAISRPPDVGGLTQDVEQLRGRIEALRADFAEEARSQRIEIGAELKSLEGLIHNLSRELMAASPAFAAAAEEEASELSQEIPAEIPDMPMRLEERLERAAEAALAEEAKDEEEVVDLLADETVEVTQETIVTVAEPMGAGELVADFIPRTAPAGEAESDPIAGAPAAGEAMLTDLREAIEANRLDLYAQPIVTLPDRKLRFYDASTRVRTAGDGFLAPSDYLPLAESEHLMPRIDNVMLVKCVQLLRRLGPDSRLKGVFCNLSAQSLRDRDFFPELVEFMEENSALAESLTFQVSQRAMLDLGAEELAGLKRLGQLGFVFSLDHVANLDVDYAALRDHFFRYVKIDAETLLHDLEQAGAAVPAADMPRFLERFDLKLIAEKVNDATSVDRLVEYGVDLAQGDVFAKPRQATPEMFRELEGADAA
jgi:cyclic-di-GMP phosphodiesterase TipF (flagellum assembly factor)